MTRTLIALTALAAIGLAGSASAQTTHLRGGRAAPNFVTHDPQIQAPYALKGESQQREYQWATAEHRTSRGKITIFVRVPAN